jgi:hypothetical protein
VTSSTENLGHHSSPKFDEHVLISMDEELKEEKVRPLEGIIGSRITKPKSALSQEEELPDERKVPVCFQCFVLYNML